MIDLVQRDSGSPRISDGGVCRALQAGTHREGNLHQAPGLFIQGTCRVAPVTQFKTFLSSVPPSRQQARSDRTCPSTEPSRNMR